MKIARIHLLAAGIRLLRPTIEFGFEGPDCRNCISLNGFGLVDLGFFYSIILLHFCKTVKIAITN
jgi:hypothetical protein